MKYQKLYEKYGYNQERALAKLNLEAPPESPEQKYQSIREFWISKGFKTVSDILISYIKADCLPLAKAIRKSLKLYHSYGVDISSSIKPLLLR